ncbi:ABC transporter ATP-binding protein [Paeniglutamicibacter sp. R2-26]|uniref:ABC transporter ATP-binding protein n=1 Tax=Paeniglutamicibacter sp. R2-26 TaxID=3144417 RepID=UPI003EE7C8A6
MNRSTNQILLEARNLAATYALRTGEIRALDDADMELHEGEVLALIGESGSGKSTVARALGGALPPNAEIVSGQALFAGEDIESLSAQQLRALHSSQIAFVEQDPLASLDPTARVGTQLRRATGIGGHAAMVELLESVSMRDPERVLRAYPRELSGGMAQRLCIAMAMARKPRLLIADEPTAALDATVKTEVLELLITRAREQNASVLLLTHDLHTVLTHADRVAIMYGGRVVESGETELVMRQPRHPYTRALLASIPGRAGIDDEVKAIPGRPPTLTAPAPGCAFAERCAGAVDSCHTTRQVPRLVEGRTVLCQEVRQIQEQPA